MLKRSNTPRYPCEACGGHYAMPRNQGIRCYGFASGDYQYCTREEFGNNVNEVNGYYRHFVKEGRQCYCGNDHKGVGIVPYRKWKVELNDGRPSDKSTEALQIWNEATDITGTPAEEYLKNRGIDLGIMELDFLAVEVIRFHPSVKHTHSDKTYNALVAALTNTDGEVKAVNITYLYGPNKADIEPNKVTLGAARTHAMQLCPAIPIMDYPKSDGVIALAAGLEDGLSVQQMYQLPTLAVPGDNYMPSVTLPEFIYKVLIFGDGDESGKKFTEKAKTAIEGKEIEVEVVIFPEGKDANDMLQDENNWFDQVEQDNS